MPGGRGKGEWQFALDRAPEWLAPQLLARTVDLPRDPLTGAWTHGILDVAITGDFASSRSARRPTRSRGKNEGITRDDCGDRER